MKDKQSITIRIADQAPIPLQIKPEEEIYVRRAENNVNQLWQSWMRSYKDLSSSRVLAMVAFQFARSFEMATRVQQHAETILTDFEAELDNILLNIEAMSEDKPSRLKDNKE